MPGKELLKKYKETKNFFNRDLSWIEFNRRVLEEALNPELPLLEKIKFISIFLTNLDEFYMIRISGLKEQIAANIIEPSIDGYTPREQIQKIEKTIQPMLKEVLDLWTETIVPELTGNGISILEYNELDESEKEILTDYFQKEIYPVLTPLAFDPEVLCIKQTLYRVGSNSAILKYLIEAAERGKQVAVLVELKARFDEQNNIFWARELEKVGVHVVYGLVGLKTHAKMTLVIRKEADGLKRYVHLSTGNYNVATAKLYTDIGMFTDDEDICADVSDIFNYLTGYSKQTDFRKLIVAPISMREKILALVNREIENLIPFINQFL